MALVTVPGLPLSKEGLPRKGNIQVIFGPMFSGKTTELIRRMKRYQIAKYKCLLIKYENDNRYDQFGVATHDRQVSAAVACAKLYDMKDFAVNYNVLGIDEGQFFPDTVEFAEEMANLGKTVVVAALDGTFQRKGFGNILDLVPLAESVVKLSAVCMNCYGEGSFTKRLGSETELEVIGGTDKYMAACRLCHDKVLDGRTTKKELKMERKPLESIENTKLTRRQKLANGMSDSLFSL